MKAYLAYSTNKETRFLASSGGFCKEMIRFCLQYNVVSKAIITVLGSGHDALRPKTIITDDIDLIMSSKSNTIYDITNPLSVLRELKQNEVYIFVGLPCHIKPMREYCVKNKIILFSISLLCNHTSNNAYARCVLDSQAINIHDVQSFEYRGNGWPGKVTIRIPEGEQQVDHKVVWQLYNEFYRDPLPKCDTCEMVLSDAEFCVGDAWLQRVIDHDDQGTNIVFIQNDNVISLIKACARANYIKIEEVEDGEMNEYLKQITKNKKKHV